MGPYGITQVDVPGALNALEAARSNRIRQMLLQRQLAQEERALEAQRGVRSAISRYTGGGDAGAASTPAPSGATGAPDALAPSVGPGIAPEPAMPSAANLTATPPVAAPAAGGHGDIGRLTTELLAIDPEHAPQIIQAFRQMDEGQFEAAQRRNTVLARAAYTLLALPEGERQAEFNRIAPDLIQNGGVTRQQLAGFQITDQNLTHVINQARDVEKLAEEARPQLRNVGPGDVIIDERNPNAGPLYESPYVRGADGTLYRRDEAAGGTAGAGTGGAGSGTPRGLRNNNPGNLEDGPFARSQPGYAGSDGRFARFETAEQGNRAQEVLLRTRYLQRPQTARQIVDRYAPPGENSDASRANYVRHIEQRLGIQPGQAIDATRARELAQAMREFENGQRGPATTAQPARVASRAEYDRLASGTEYIAPDGSRRRKP
jgi:hypothetical protein